MRGIAKLTTLITASLLLVLAANASAATLESIGSFDQPTYVTSDPADPNRLFIVEREGRAVVFEKGERTVFADLESLVTCCLSERGLLSIALAPDFGSTERFYAMYTGTELAGGTIGDIHVDAFVPDPGGGGVPARDEILHIDHDDHPNHHGGQLHFGPDGYLYISVGDGGGAGDPEEEAQKLETLHGKILRIDPKPAEEPPYSVPADNPFVGVTGADEIWSLGLRNPWRFSFDRDTDDMVVADVGQGQREEVDFAPSPGAGLVGGRAANYGWACREGLIAYVAPPEYCVGLDPSAFTDPVFDYPHDNPGGGPNRCSITGGYVVRDPTVTDLFGRYVYADFCDGEIRSLALPGAGGGAATGDRSEGLTVDSPVSFGEDSSGRVYVVSQDGNVYRLGPGEPPQPPPTPPSGDPTPKEPGSPGPPKGRVPKPRERAPRVSLDAERVSGPASRRFRLTARVIPCTQARGATVRLNRGGNPSGTKRLSKGCAATFTRRVRDRSSFRALVLAAGTTLRSARLVLTAAR